jgi:hypothetical protein
MSQAFSPHKTLVRTLLCWVPLRFERRITALERLKDNGDRKVHFIKATDKADSDVSRRSEAKRRRGGWRGRASPVAAERDCQLMGWMAP